MAKCDYCGSSIWFGGSSQGNLKFCSKSCHENGLMAVAAQAPAEDMARLVRDVHQGDCPVCKGPGPVDLRNSYFIWSAVFMTQWSTRPRLSCRPCGTKEQAKFAALSFITGWWGIPWGILGTPVQVGRNIAAMLSRRDETTPSAQLATALKRAVAADMIAYQAANPLAAPPPSQAQIVQ